MRRVGDFRMELQAVEPPGIIGNHRERRGLGRRHRAEPGRQAGDAVAMAHPHLLTRADRPHAIEQRTIGGHVDQGAAELAVLRRGNLAAELRTQKLLAIADPQDRHAEFKDRLRRERRARLMHGGGAARQDHRPWAPRADAVGIGAERPNLAIDAGLSYAPGNELGDLAAEIQDQDALGFDLGGRIVGHAGQVGRNQRLAARGRSESKPECPPVSGGGRTGQLRSTPVSYQQPYPMTVLDPSTNPLRGIGAVGEVVRFR